MRRIGPAKRADIVCGDFTVELRLVAADIAPVAAFTGLRRFGRILIGTVGGRIFRRLPLYDIVIVRIRHRCTRTLLGGYEPADYKHCLLYTSDAADE